MSETGQTISCTIADIENAKAGLLSDPPVWPEPGEIDVAGAQLIAAALIAGLTVPAALATDPTVTQLWSALSLDAALPLSR